MAHRSTVRNASRLAALLAVSGLAWLSSTGPAGAATPPDPLGGGLPVVTGPVTSTVTQLLGGAATPVPAPKPQGGLPAGPALPATPALPALPGLPGQGSGDAGGDQPGASAHAQAPAGDDLAAVDAAVAEFLGVCARVPQGVVPVRADIVVLDRNVIEELVDAGVPLRPLVVPCPAAAGDPATPPSSSPGAAGPGQAGRPHDTGGPRSALPTALAFTGTDIAPTLLLASGMIALGIAFLRKARTLSAVR